MDDYVHRRTFMKCKPLIKRRHNVVSYVVILHHVTVMRDIWSSHQYMWTDLLIKTVNYKCAKLEDKFLDLILR